MLESPTVASLAAAIGAGPAGAAGLAGEAAVQEGASPLVVLGPLQRGPATVLVHDGTGTLAAYGEPVERLRPLPADVRAAWEEVCIGELTVVDLPGDDDGVLLGAGADAVAGLLHPQAPPALSGAAS